MRRVTSAIYSSKAAPRCAAAVPAAFLHASVSCRTFSSCSLKMCAATTSSSSESQQPLPSAPSSSSTPLQTPSSPSAASAADAAASALDVATRVNKLKRLHQTGGSANTGKKQIEFTAWKELNTLTEEQISHAEGKAVALLLNSWAYFAKFWEKGKDGPMGAAAEGSNKQQQL